ncbi:MAG: zinc-binding alcohol dehydrogenase family protein [Bacteroidota bacterium]|nr:zinc-binding alcohol dehydrogenase family protein [Bacteroidota bacterium]
MNALVCTSPRKLEYQEVPTPVLRQGQAILKIRRIGICGTDLHAFEGTQPFLSYPRIFGHEIAADLVEADGQTGLVSGEPVTVIPYIHCGQCMACRAGRTNCCSSLQVFGVHIDGGMAEYLSVPSALVLSSHGLNYDQLALVEPLCIGAHGIRRAALQPKEVVLIMGAGPIGLSAMAFAQLSGATVIAMDLNPARLAFCKNVLGIPYGIDPSREEAFQAISQITGGEMASVVIDATGNLDAINSGLQYLAHAGRYVLIGLQKEAFSFSHPEFHRREATLMSSRNATAQDFDYVMQMIQTGRIQPELFISQKVGFNKLRDAFPDLVDSAKLTIKTLVEFPQ